MSLGAGLLALALLVQPRPVYHWRDAQGQPHVTDTPPPPGAAVVEAPPPPALEPGTSALPAPRHGRPVRQREAGLSPVQRAAWEAVDQRLALARSRNDTRILKAVADSLVDDCLWNGGLWARPVLPVLAVALLGLLGWWLALGQGLALRVPILGAFLLLGLAFGQVLLATFLYQPQARRLRQNLELLELHLGGRDLSPANEALLLHRYQAVENAAHALQPPWRFPAEVAALRRDVKRVVIDP